MTYTEIIAVKLFGWEAAGPCRCGLSDCNAKEFVGPRNARVAIEHDRAFDLNPCSTYEWPDLADYNWIRRMEDALAERGLGKTYAQHLVSSLAVLPYDDGFDCVAVPCLRATAKQRVEAAVKVLEGK